MSKSFRCCVVGGGPGGVMLSYLLARRGVPVTLLEAHHDFDRDFRGDTVHPSTLEILDQFGLAHRLLELPHRKMSRLDFHTEEGIAFSVDMTRLKTRFPYVMMLPQVDFLNFMVDEAKKYPSFKIIMGANVQRLIERDGKVCGVRYRDTDSNWHDVEAELTVGADGRFSKLRRLANLTPEETAPPMDVLWFRLPRESSDNEEAGAGIVGRGELLVLLNRKDEWQAGFVIPKGEFKRFKEAGIGVLRESVSRLAPWLSDRANLLQDWKQVQILSVASSCLKRWFKPGLLLIGDAAHVMSPVGGVGINYAIQDAVVAANVLAKPLSSGRVSTRDLYSVQRKRMKPTRFIQTVQRILQRRLVTRALGGKPFRIPLLLRLLLKLPCFRALPARLIGVGLTRVKVRS